MNAHVTNLLSSLLIALGLAAAGAAVGYGILTLKAGERSVSVRGLAEREVKADLALWPLRVKVADNDLAIAQGQMEKNLSVIREFLGAQGFAENEIEVKALRVVDKRAQEYGGNNAAELRYIIDAMVSLRSNKVDAVVAASAKIGDLLKQGVPLTDDNNCSPGPQYSFTKLNDVKPEMLKEATQSALAAAKEFAANSGAQVGALKSASQGVFSITSRDMNSETGEGGGCSPSDPNKKLRVVTSLQYYLQ